MADWEEANDTSEGPMSTFLRFPVVRSGHRILGGPGTRRSRWVIMVVRGSFRIRVTSVFEIRYSSFYIRAENGLNKSTDSTTPLLPAAFLSPLSS
jgi:hypothetical protein